MKKWHEGLDRKDWMLDGERTSIAPALWDSLDWSRAYADFGPSPSGNSGPYFHVPHYRGPRGATWHAGDCVHRLYPRVPARLWLLVRKVALGVAASPEVARRLREEWEESKKKRKP